jgi:sugar lactone lactonase YvrE
LLIDPEGNVVWGRSGEFKAEQVREILNAAIPFYRAHKLLDEKPFPLELEADAERVTPLRFPGKVLADEAGGRLFITDSSHNRIVIATFEGKLLETIGSGQIGRADGDFQTATFDHPQGCALHGETLYVADTENHLIRKVDLLKKTVTTIAGTGIQAAHPWLGLDEAEAIGRPPARFVGLPAATAINSPWALWVHKTDLYIAMAGPHQIWKMTLDEREIGPYAGNGREDIVDGRLLPKVPYMMGFSSFAQPSGLSSDGTWLYVADSEGSSIRAVPFDKDRFVKTVVGSDNKDYGRLFEFGDKDGPRNVAKLQHCLEVVHLKGKIYVADTYNHKIKMVDAKNGETKTIAGTGQRGKGDDPAEFHEPAGLAHAGGLLYVADTNNHLIRTIDLATGQVATLTIAGLTAPGAAEGKAAAAPKKPAFKNAAQEKLKPANVKPVDGKIKLAVALQVPTGWKMNPDAPMSYWLDSPRESGPADRTAFGRTKVTRPASDFEVTVPVAESGEDVVAVSLNYYYCEDKPEGVCKVGSVVFTVPLVIAADGASDTVKLVHAIK